MTGSSQNGAPRQLRAYLVNAAVALAALMGAVAAQEKQQAPAPPGFDYWQPECHHCPCHFSMAGRTVLCVRAPTGSNDVRWMTRELWGIRRRAFNCWSGTTGPHAERHDDEVVAPHDLCEFRRNTKAHIQPLVRHRRGGRHRLPGKNGWAMVTWARPFSPPHYGRERRWHQVQNSQRPSIKLTGRPLADFYIRGRVDRPLWLRT